MDDTEARKGFGRAGRPAAGERVLELGCGRGAATVPAAERVGPSGHVHAPRIGYTIAER